MRSSLSALRDAYLNLKNRRCAGLAVPRAEPLPFVSRSHPIYRSTFHVSRSSSVPTRLAGVPCEVGRDNRFVIFAFAEMLVHGQTVRVILSRAPIICHEEPSHLASTPVVGMRNSRPLP